MSETIASTQGPSDVPGPGRVESLQFRMVVAGVLLVLALAVMMLRLQRLSELPPGLYYDEGAHGVDALRVLHGEHAAFFPENKGREGLIVYAIAMTTSLLGRTILAVRLPTALASAGTVFAIFWLGQLLFGRDGETGRATPWRGLLVGGVGAGLMAVSLAQTVIGRTALRANFMPLLLCLCLGLLWEGWRCRSRRRVALAGVCAGLLAYTYIAARFTPFLFLLFGLSFLIPWGRSESGGEKTEKRILSHRFSVLTSRLRVELPWASIFTSVAALVAAPILIYFILNPEHFLSRSNDVWLFRDSQGDLQASLFLRNVWEHLLVFGFYDDQTALYDYSVQPLMGQWEALFFWLGVGITVWRLQQPAHRLLLLWLGLLLLPAVLSRDVAVPHTLRMIGAVPAVYLLAGVGVWGTIRFRPLISLFYAMGTMIRLEKLKSPVKSIAKTTQFRVEDETRAAIAVGMLVGGLILVQGVLTYRTYFQKWAGAATEIEQLYWTQWQELTQVINARSAAVDAAYLIPSHAWHYSFEYLDQNAPPAHVVYLGAPNLTEKITSTLAAVENVSAVKIVDWYDDISHHAFHYETERLIVLLDKYGRYLGSDEYDAFQVHTYTDFDLDRPWTIYEYLEPLAVYYDRGITLHGFALTQDKEQLSSLQPQFDPGQSRSLWVALRWETAPGLDIDYSISLRLHNAEGGMVYQGDDVLWRSTDNAPTSGWEAQELVDTLHLLEIPAELQPGEFELRLVVYDFETQQPTVELGVWEPEYVLARLRLEEIE